MTLAPMLMLTLAITVSAASVSGGGTYEGYGYETVDTCDTNSYSCMTNYDFSPGIAEAISSAVNQCLFFRSAESHHAYCIFLEQFSTRYSLIHSGLSSICCNWHIFSFSFRILVIYSSTSSTSVGSKFA